MNVGGAIEGLFYAFVVAVASSVILLIVVLWQTFFGFNAWSVCGKLDNDAAIVQCMEIYNE